jgi:hypothetical protein
MLHKLGLTILIILLVGVMAAACIRPITVLAPSPESDSVATIVKATLQAFLSATPIPSLIPVPSETPTPTLPVPMPVGWVIYWSEQYGFAFSHPNLFDCYDQCGLSMTGTSNVEVSVVNLALEKTLMWGTDAPFDGFSLTIGLNKNDLSFRDYVDREKQAIFTSVMYGGLPIQETDISGGGQNGVLLSLRDGGSLAAYLPMPNSKMILAFFIGEQYQGSFIDTFKQILSTLRFISDSSPLSAMATQTAAAVTPPVQKSYEEFASLNQLQEQTPFKIWTPAFVPDDLPFLKGWMAEFMDGSQEVALIYSEPGDPADATLRNLEIRITKTDKTLSMDLIHHQFRIIPLNLTIANMHGQAGYFYWTASVATGNSAHLEWRENGFNFSIELFGDWPQPDAIDPGRLNPLLFQVADGLQHP